MPAAAEIKGTTFQLRLRFVRERWGEEAVERVLAAMAPDDAAVVRGALPIGWYPLALNARLDEAISRTMTDGGETVYRELGSHAAVELAREIYSAYVADATPREFLEASTKMYRLHYRNAGSKRDEFPGPGVAEVTFEGGAETYRSNCVSKGGFLTKGVEVSGGREVSCEEVGCALRGDPACVFRLRWIE